MSFCYDTLEKAWGLLREQLPVETRQSELTIRFEFLLMEMHEANHRLNDGINKDDRVTRQARQLDSVISDRSKG